MNPIQGCSKFFIPCQVCWGRKSSCVEEKEIPWLWKEYNIGKIGSKIIFILILRLLGRIYSGREGKRRKLFGKKIRFKKLGGGEEYEVVGN